MKDHLSEYSAGILETVQLHTQLMLRNAREKVQFSSPLTIVAVTGQVPDGKSETFFSIFAHMANGSEHISTFSRIAEMPIETQLKLSMKELEIIHSPTLLLDAQTFEIIRNENPKIQILSEADSHYSVIMGLTDTLSQVLMQGPFEQSETPLYFPDTT